MGVARLFAAAERWQAVERLQHPAAGTSLAERMADLDRRIAGTTDDITREQYQQARDALAEQLRYIDEIGVSRDRALARMHNYVATMERLRMAAVNLRSTDASRDDQLGTLLSSLKELGADMDASSEALLEAERAAAPDA